MISVLFSFLYKAHIINRNTNISILFMVIGMVTVSKETTNLHHHLVSGERSLTARTLAFDLRKEFSLTLHHLFSHYLLHDNTFSKNAGD